MQNEDEVLAHTFGILTPGLLAMEPFHIFRTTIKIAHLGTLILDEKENITAKTFHVSLFASLLKRFVYLA